MYIYTFIHLHLVCTHYALFVMWMIKSSDKMMMSHEQVPVAVDTRRNAAVESALAVASKLIARGCPSQLAAYMQGMHLIYAICFIFTYAK